MLAVYVICNRNCSASCFGSKKPVRPGKLANPAQLSLASLHLHALQLAMSQILHIHPLFAIFTVLASLAHMQP